MSLTDTAARNAKPTAKPYKLADEKALYLLVNPNGSKWWRLKYRFGGKEMLLSLGVYPDVSLKDARTKRDQARNLLANGVNPSAHRQMEKTTRSAAAANSFEAIALEWMSKVSSGWAPDHAARVKRRLEVDVFPWLGTRPIADIKAPDLLAVVRRIEARGALDTAHRALQNCGQVFRYAVATGRAERDPSGDLRGALAPVDQRHHASITDPKGIGDLLRAIHAYKGEFITRCALRFAPYVFVRPGELRRAEWSEIDLEAGEWRIPGDKMKMGAVHIVPLAAQAVDVLRELRALTGEGQYVFPGVRSLKRPMSENTVLAALRRMGFTGSEMTGHGFRSMASTRLHEMGWNHHAIERQLAHGERNKVSAAYNYAEHLPERRKMMQAWGDYLDVLREDRKIIAGKFGRAA